jgi:hypothetical protein
MAVMLLAATAGVGVAKISPPACENPSGNEPGGQQPTCKNENPKFTQRCAENPAGKCPGGHN